MNFLLSKISTAYSKNGQRDILQCNRLKWCSYRTYFIASETPG